MTEKIEDLLGYVVDMEWSGYQNLYDPGFHSWIPETMKLSGMTNNTD